VSTRVVPSGSRSKASPCATRASVMPAAVKFLPGLGDGLGAQVATVQGTVRTESGPLDELQGRAAEGVDHDVVGRDTRDAREGCGHHGVGRRGHLGHSIGEARVLPPRHEHRTNTPRVVVDFERPQGPLRVVDRARAAGQPRPARRPRRGRDGGRRGSTRRATAGRRGCTSEGWPSPRGWSSSPRRGRRGRRQADVVGRAARRPVRRSIAAREGP
jgi:hypothetical protein